MFRELKEHFSDYTEQVVKLMVPMLKFYFHDGVRTAAAESLPFLLECAKIKGPAYLQEMWGFMLPELLKVGFFMIVIKSSVSGVYIISETHIPPFEIVFSPYARLKNRCFKESYAARESFEEVCCGKKMTPLSP